METSGKKKIGMTVLSGVLAAGLSACSTATETAQQPQGRRRRVRLNSRERKNRGKSSGRRPWSWLNSKDRSPSSAIRRFRENSLSKNLKKRIRK